MGFWGELGTAASTFGGTSLAKYMGIGAGVGAVWGGISPGMGQGRLGGAMSGAMSGAFWGGIAHAGARAGRGYMGYMGAYHGGNSGLGAGKARAIAARFAAGDTVRHYGAQLAANVPFKKIWSTL